MSDQGEELVFQNCLGSFKKTRKIGAIFPTKVSHGGYLMSDEWQKLEAALENDSYKWRTISGISVELDMPEETILRLIEDHADQIVKSSVPSKTGEDLYSTRKHYRKKSSVLGAISQSLTGRVR